MVRLGRVWMIRKESINKNSIKILANIIEVEFIDEPYGWVKLIRGMTNHEEFQQLHYCIVVL